MSHLIVLPGNSPRNRAWSESCVDYFSLQFNTVHMQTYDHWESAEQWLDFAIEQHKLQQHVAELPTSTAVTIMAKSIGTILALKSIKHAEVAPTRCVFFGMPLDLAAADIFQNDWSPLRDLTIPTMAFHNDADPTASYDFTKATVAELAPSVELVTCQDNTHDYCNFDEYFPKINAFLS